MFKYGTEQPIVNNEALLEMKDEYHTLMRDSSKGRSLNRYSFLSKEKDSSSTAVPHLMCELLKQINLHVFIVVTWPTDPPRKSPIAAKIIENRCLKQGWHINVREKHRVAIKQVAHNSIDIWPPLPLGIDRREVGFILLIGEQREGEILETLNEKSSAFLARNGYFVPNTIFFDGLASENTSVIYQVNDNLGNIGIVLLGSHSICMMGVKNIDIDNQYDGEYAYKVFS